MIQYVIDDLKIKNINKVLLDHKAAPHVLKISPGRLTATQHAAQALPVL